MKKQLMSALLMASLTVMPVSLANQQYAQKFMVSAANPHATQIGYDILKIGGTAADAMVAVQMMLNLVEPQSSGIGGGAFLLYWDNKAKKLHTFDGREKAPLSATPNYFIKEDGSVKGWWEAVIGGGSVGVPGTLKLLDVVHLRFGNLPWAALIHPTIDKADAGFAVSPRLAASIAQHHTEKRQLAKFARTRRYFFNADGSPKSVGTVLTNSDFATTLREIADKRSAAFYHGEIAADIVKTVARDFDNPGQLTLEDFKNYELIERDPVCIRYRVYNVCGMGPPTSGGITVGQILGILEPFKLHKIGTTADSAHLFAEASRLAYADRASYLADSDFVDVPVRGLLNKGYLKSRSTLINKAKAMKKASAGTPPFARQAYIPGDTLDRPGTSHFVIVDSEGNIASMTTTIETGFGSRLMTHGFLLNNELTDFSRVAEKNGIAIANRIEGGKRPRSSMSPTIVFRHKKPYLAIGSPGGSRIIDYVAQSVVGVLDFKMTPQQAINQGHIINRNGATELEEGTAVAEWAEVLSERGHDVKVRVLNSGLHAIQFTGKGLLGGADSRREGIVLGD